MPWVVLLLENCHFEIILLFLFYRLFYIVYIFSIYTNDLKVNIIGRRYYRTQIFSDYSDYLLESQASFIVVVWKRVAGSDPDKYLFFNANHSK